MKHKGGCNIKPYSYYCFILFIFQIDPVGVGLPPLLWYFLYITCSDIALTLSIYTYLKRFDLTFLEQKNIQLRQSYWVLKLLTSPTNCQVFLTILLKDCFKITLSPSAAHIYSLSLFKKWYSKKVKNETLRYTTFILLSMTLLGSTNRSSHRRCSVTPVSRVSDTGVSLWILRNF